MPTIAPIGEKRSAMREDFRSPEAIAMRWRLAAAFQDSQRRSGEMWTVKTEGQYADTMRISWPFMTRARAEIEVRGDDAGPTMKLIGFKRLVFTNGVETWSFDL